VSKRERAEAEDRRIKELGRRRTPGRSGHGRGGGGGGGGRRGGGGGGGVAALETL